MKRKQKNIFQKLPTYTPNKSVWRNIEDKLDTHNINTNPDLFKNKLPQYNAPDRVWKNIESTLQKNNKRKILFYSTKIAASFILIIGITFIIKSYLSNNFNDYNILYEIEYTSDSEGIMGLDFIDNSIELNKILADKCEYSPKICNNENFIELKDIFNKLVVEKNSLKNQFKKFKDPKTITSLIKIENEMVNIEKYMLEMFNKKN